MKRLLLFLMSVVVTSGPAWADEVLLKNGDRLTGAIKRMTDGELTLQTDLAGEVTIALDDIDTFRTDEAIEIHFADGTVIHQPVSAAETGQIAIEEEGVLEPQVFELADVTRINPPPVRWRGDLSLGLQVSRGNADTESANFALDMVRRGERDRFTLGAGYFYGRQRDPDTGERNTTENNWFVMGKYDYFFTPRFYGYGNARVERDRIANLDLRLAPGVGVGYQWIETERLEFRTEGGLTWFYESFLDDTETRRTLSGRLAYDVRYRLNDRLRLFHDLEYFPSLESLRDYYITTQAGLRSSLTDSMFAELKVVLDYDSTPAETAERLDTRYIASVGWSF